MSWLAGWWLSLSGRQASHPTIESIPSSVDANNELLIWEAQNCWTTKIDPTHIANDLFGGPFRSLILRHCDYTSNHISLMTHLDLDHLLCLLPRSFLNQHLVVYVFFLIHSFRFHHRSLDSHSLSQATEQLHFHQVVESHPVQLPYRWPSTGARSPRHPGEPGCLRLGRSTLIMES